MPQITTALNAAIYEPALRVFPQLKSSDFSHFHSDPISTGTWAFTADTEQIASSTDGAVGGFGGPRLGNTFGNHAGSHSSQSYYAAAVPVLPADEMFVISQPEMHSKELGVVSGLLQAATVQAVPVTAFNQLILDTRKTRNTITGSLRAAEASMSTAAQGILAWVTPQRGCDVIGKGYNNSPGIYDGSEFYRESLFHIALSGCVKEFIYYHAWAETPWDIDLDVMSDTIAELENVTAFVTGRRNGSLRGHSKQDGGCVPLTAATAVPWSTPHVVSGAAFSGHHIFRVTMRTRPNQTGTLSDHPGMVMIVSEDPFTYWPTNVARWFAITPVPGAKCLFSGCVRGDDAGVWLVSSSADAVGSARPASLKTDDQGSASFCEGPGWSTVFKDNFDTLDESSWTRMDAVTAEDFMTVSQQSIKTDDVTAEEAPPLPPAPPPYLSNMSMFQYTLSGNNEICLDGTPGVIYMRNGTGSGSRSFYIHYQGGGWCESPSDCAGRSRTHLGSSRGYEAGHLTGHIQNHGRGCPSGGYFSTVQATNPLMWNWNVVYLMYCDGGSWTGSRSSPYRADNSTLHFHGKEIRDGAQNMLMTKLGLDRATDVVISGASAGALAVYLTVDRWCDAVKTNNSSATCVGLPDAGLFLDYQSPTTLAQPPAPGTFRSAMKWDYETFNSSGGVNQDCIAAKKGSDCIFAEHTAPFSRAPIFALQSQYDEFQMVAVLSNASVKNVNELGANITRRLDSGVLRSHPDSGTFFDSCVHHTFWGSSSDYFSSIRIDGDLVMQAFQKWYLGLGDPTAKKVWRQQELYPCADCCGLRSHDRATTSFKSDEDAHTIKPFRDEDAWAFHQLCSSPIWFHWGRSSADSGGKHLGSANGELRVEKCRGGPGRA